MTSQVATVVCVIGILGCFLLDRDRETRISPVLWLPIAWLAIGASRNISRWFGLWSVSPTASDYLDGSPLDRAIFTGMIAIGVLVLVSRRQRAWALLRRNAPLLLFLLYCA